MPMTGYRSPKMNAIVEDAVAQGIVVVTAAGKNSHSSKHA